ncbi:MAG: rRNA pseudouridine synthase [Clostridia bacterium]|nr:rRNA pseudouridine synthase [Clostridia bacterium]
MEEVRLQKFLALCGAASRRKAEELIKQGRVHINGITVTDMGIKVTEEDLVELDGKRLRKEPKKVYIMLHKPTGYVTTSKDQFSRKTVLDLVEGIEERLYPVGRLDYDTSGLLLLTNDGEFTFKLTHPKHEIEKVYIARIQGIPSEAEMGNFRQGLRIEDYTTSPAGFRVIGKSGRDTLAEIIIHEGKNRQVRKMCEAIGHPVIELKREAIGNLALGNLKEGHWRHLELSEIKGILTLLDG